MLPCKVVLLACWDRDNEVGDSLRQVALIESAVGDDRVFEVLPLRYCLPSAIAAQGQKLLLTFLESRYADAQVKKGGHAVLFLQLLHIRLPALKP